MTFTVTITGVTLPVEVYIGLSAAKDYVGAMDGDGAVAWAGLTDDAAAGVRSRSKVLASVTRYLDSLSWAGAPTTPAVGGTTLKFPMTGLVYADGSAVDPSTVPADFQKAVGELCALVSDDPDVLAASDTGANIKGLGGGADRIDFFNPTSISTGTATKLPTAVQRLVGKWLSSSGPVASGGFSQSGKCETDASPCEDLSRKRLPW